MDALSRANYVRIGRAEIKREITQGMCSVLDVIECQPDVCDSMSIRELLCLQHRWGLTRVRKFLNECRYLTPPLALNENRQIGKLTKRERRVLLVRLEERYELL